MALSPPAAGSAARLPRQVVFLFAGALALVVAQLGWWTFFHVRFSLGQSRWQASQWAQEREAAARLVVLTANAEAAAAGGPAEAPPAALPAALVGRYFPRLGWVASVAGERPAGGPAEAALAELYPGGALRVDPRAIDELRGRDRAHVRMFVFEGGFFLGLLGLGAVMLWRVLRHEVALLRQQANFLSAVTHELKSPLAAIRLFCETLQMRRLEPATQKRYLGTMLSEVDRLDGMVGNLLAVARLEAGRFVVQRGRLELGEQVAGWVEQLCGEAPPEGVVRPAIVYRPPAAPVWVDGDVGALGCIVRNLLDNALKYGRHEDRPIEVEVGAGDDAAWVLVRDHGIGLTSVELARVFTKFYRVGDEMVRQSEGTGLGLYLARALAEAHGGHLTAQSDGVGVGASFVVTLPLAARAAA